MATEQSGGFASNVKEKVTETAGQIADRVRETRDQAEHLVQQRPGQSMLVAFSAGVGVGLGLALLLTRQSQPASRSMWHSIEHLGQSIASAIQNALPEAISKSSS